MTRNTNLIISGTADNKVQFTDNVITITINNFLHNDGKHIIVEPGAAKAQFVCAGEHYAVDNIQCISTVEEWYRSELLPKFQMLTLLSDNTEVEY